MIQDDVQAFALVGRVATRLVDRRSQVLAAPHEELKCAIGEDGIRLISADV